MDPAHDDEPAADHGAERFEVTRSVAAPPAAVFALLRSPRGHVSIDSTGMLQAADGPDVGAVGDTFVVHMDREALGDRPMGRYDVTVVITGYEADRALEWTILGTIRPPMEHRYGYLLTPEDPQDPAEGGDTGDIGDGAGRRTVVTSYYDWSRVPERYRTAGVFPVIPEANLRATLGILARTVEEAAGASRQAPHQDDLT